MSELKDVSLFKRPLPQTIALATLVTGVVLALPALTGSTTGDHLPTDSTPAPTAAETAAINEKNRLLSLAVPPSAQQPMARACVAAEQLILTDAGQKFLLQHGVANAISSGPQSNVLPMAREEVYTVRLAKPGESSQAVFCKRVGLTTADGGNLTFTLAKDNTYTLGEDGALPSR